MKRVLIVSYHFDNKNQIGSVRIRGLVRYLPSFGWQPTVLTAGPIASISQGDIIVARAPCKEITQKWKSFLGLSEDAGIQEQLGWEADKNKANLGDKILKIWEEIFVYPDNRYPWHKEAVSLGEKLRASEKYDAIISSSDPITSNLIAKDLKMKFSIPWIADFRDLWTQNHYYPYSKIRHFFEERLELKILSHADALTTVSYPLSQKLKQLHKEKDAYTIPNGFDPCQKNEGTPLRDKFTITYTGTLYRGRRDPVSLFVALNELISNRSIDPIDISVEFYGDADAWILSDADRYGLKNIVKTNGLISREESIDKQRHSHMLLLLTWNNPDERGVYTGKLFDYLAAMRPILSIGISRGVVEALLNETHAGVHASNIHEIEQELLRAYSEFKLTGTLSNRSIPSEIDKYTHIEMARKFSEILDKLIEKN